MKGTELLQRVPKSSKTENRERTLHANVEECTGIDINYMEGTGKNIRELLHWMSIQMVGTEHDGKVTYLLTD